MTDASVVVAEPYLRWRGSESGGDGEPQAIPQGSGAGGGDHLHVGDVDDGGFSTLGILLPPLD